MVATRSRFTGNGTDSIPLHRKWYRLDSASQEMVQTRSRFTGNGSLFLGMWLIICTCTAIWLAVTVAALLSEFSLSAFLIYVATHEVALDPAAVRPDDGTGALLFHLVRQCALVAAPEASDDVATRTSWIAAHSLSLPVDFIK